MTTYWLWFAVGCWLELFERACLAPGPETHGFHGHIVHAPSGRPSARQHGLQTSTTIHYICACPAPCIICAGQLWGSPLYKWSEHKRERYDWWCKRMGRALELYDETRIDHFRGFAGGWHVTLAHTNLQVMLWLHGRVSWGGSTAKATSFGVQLMASYVRYV